MRRVLMGALLALLLVVPATAQAQSESKTLSGVTCPGSGCLETEISSTGQIAVQVTGTFNGTIMFERTVDGVTWAPWTLTSLSGASVSTTTTTGLWTGTTEGSAEYRIRFSIYWSGSASATYNFVQSGSGNFSAKYLLAQEDDSLPNAQVLGDVAAGLLKNVVTPGVNPLGTLTAAVAGVDYLAPTGSGTGLSGVGLLSNPLSQFGPTTSAQLASTLSDEEGSGGGFVRAQQPTIVAPTIGRIANLTQNGVVRTINGDGTLSIGSALPDCVTGESPRYNGSTWVCFTAADTAGSYSNPSWLTTVAWSKVTGTPTTVAGYAIADAVSTGGSYANPSWLTSLAWGKVTGTPTTIAGYSISDAVGTGGSYSDPSWLVALAWSKVTGKPTTLSGYGITDGCAGAATPGTYGSTTAIPVVTVAASGCVSTVTTANPFARGTITASDPFTLTQTWNNSAVTFIGRSLEITNTDSGGASLLDRILLGGQVVWSLSRAGYAQLTGGMYISGEIGTSGGTLFERQAGYTYIHNTGGVRLGGGAAGPYTHASYDGMTSPKIGGSFNVPSISGNATLVANSFDVNGKITSTVTGSGSAVLTFAAAFTAAPSCFANNTTASTFAAAVSTTTTLTISGTWTTGDVIVYACIGREP